MEQIDYDIDDFINYCEVKNLSKKTVSSYEQTLRLFAIFLKEECQVKEAEQVKEIHIREYMKNLQDEDWTREKLNSYYTAIYPDDIYLDVQKVQELLKQYPGNDIILSNLTYVLQALKKYDELINLCKTLIASTKHDDIRFDTARVLAETYRSVGEYAMCAQTIEQIPEFFFTHLEEKALLLDGEDMFRPAWQQKEHSLDSFVWMSMRLADYYEAAGDIQKAKHQLQQAKDVVSTMKDDDIPPFWKENYYMSSGTIWIERINARLDDLADPCREQPHNTFDFYRRFY